MQQAVATVIEHRKVDDLARLWEDRLRKQAQYFESFAAQVLKNDTEIYANVGQIKSLHAEHTALKSRQEKLDTSIQQIADQQQALSQLLTGLQGALTSRLQPGACDEAWHRQSRGLAVQLDEMDQQVGDLAKETKAMQSKRYTDPLAVVVRVLDAHAGAIESIGQRAEAVAARCAAVEALL